MCRANKLQFDLSDLPPSHVIMSSRYLLRFVRRATHGDHRSPNRHGSSISWDVALKLKAYEPPRVVVVALSCASGQGRRGGVLGPEPERKRKLNVCWATQKESRNGLQYSCSILLWRRS